MIQLDTHVVAWLFLGETGRLSSRATDLIERAEILYSPMVELELQYLFEVGRTTLPAADVILDLKRRIGLRRVDVPFHQVVAEALGLSWTRDPFDRLIAATALATATPLLTADETILEHCDLAIWR